MIQLQGVCCGTTVFRATFVENTCQSPRTLRSLWYGLRPHHIALPAPARHRQSKLKAMHAKEVAILNQYKDRWPSTPPPPMSVRKCRPLERILFLNEFRRAHLDFWKNNHPSYPDFSLGSLPPLVRRIYRVGQGYRKPKDVIPPPSGGNIEPTIVPEIARLRASKKERLSPYNHNPHFPYFVTHFTDSMPICSVGGELSDVLFNPKYAGHIYKVTVAVDNLGNIVWICDLMPGTSADVMIWDQRGPSRTHGQFFDFEIGAHDGAYKGRLHTAVPYIGRKTLTDDQQEYNDVHGFYRARVEHLFARLWQWRIVRNVWTRSATELHGHVRILLHLTQFCIRRQTRYQPYGPWPHVPESVWAQEEATVVEEENDDGVCCQLCGHRPGDISECGTCHLNMCASCMPLHSCTL